MDKEYNSRLSVCPDWHLTQERHVWTQNMRNVFKEKKLLCGSVCMLGLVAAWPQQTHVLNWLGCWEQMAWPGHPEQETQCL